MDCLIVGGGVIGLSLAYELATRGERVRLLDRGLPGQEASWAGAGILPPAALRHTEDPLEELTRLSNSLHLQWSARLREETGIDNGYRACGGIYLARTEEEASELQAHAGTWQKHEIAAEPLSRELIKQLEPNIRTVPGYADAWLLKGESQLRNPRHVKALLAACGRLVVDIFSNVEAEGFEVSDGRVTSVITSVGKMSAGTICLTTGSFTQRLTRQLGITVAIKPVRGQMVLLNCSSPVVSHVINVGKKYIVPRADGRVLAGSTEEDVGFNRGTTSGAIGGLIAFACDLVPKLGDAPLERHWAGLRPATVDGLPYLGALPELKNVYLAAGHFRSGLQLSTGTAAVMAQLIAGEKPEVDLRTFRVGRSQIDATIE